MNDRVTLKMLYDLHVETQDGLKRGMQELEIKILDRIRAQDAETRIWIAALKESADSTHSRQDNQLEKHNKTLYGNGTPGLKAQMFAVWGGLSLVIALLIPILLGILSFLGLLAWSIVTGRVTIATH